MIWDDVLVKTVPTFPHHGHEWTLHDGLFVKKGSTFEETLGHWIDVYLAPGEPLKMDGISAYWKSMDTAASTITFASMEKAMSELAKVKKMWVSEEPTHTPHPHPLFSLTEIIPGMTSHAGPCPECRQHHGDVANTIITLNDEHMWTREQVADWLDTTDFDLTVRERHHDPVNEEQPEVGPADGGFLAALHL